MPRHPSASTLSKVPEVAAVFWVTKVLTTGMGETASDYLARTFNPVVVVALAGLALLGSLVFQLTRTRYIPWAYWLAVVMVSVFGTMAADIVHVILGVPYALSTAAFSLALAATFAGWWMTERTLSVHSITTTRRELFYWATVLLTFALGTAVGDLTAVTLHLGYLASGIAFAVAIALPALGYRFAGLGEVTAFWSAYVLTRPLGASFADWAGVPLTRGGLGLGTGPVTLALTVVIVALVAYLGVLDARTPPLEIAEQPAD